MNAPESASSSGAAERRSVKPFDDWPLSAALLVFLLLCTLFGGAWVLQYFWLRPASWAPFALLALLLSTLLGLSVYRLARHLRRHLQHIAGLLPLLGQKQFQQVREHLHTRHHWIEEFNRLEDNLNHLSYQLEGLDKSASLRSQEVERLSLFDPLTGLANRQLLHYELQSDLQQQLPAHPRAGLVVVMLLDLDNFKRINDSLGHHLGDQILETMAKRLKGAIGTRGLVAHPGGDEFALLLHTIKRAEQLPSLSQKVLELVSKPLQLDTTTLVINCSIGVAIAGSHDSPEDLLKHAEIAMYKAKNSGGNSFCLFDAQMAAEALDSLSLESELRRALADSEFTLYLQPKVDMEGVIRGFESLVRWEHPDRGLLPPGEFVAAMEAMSFISQLDNWMLEASCRQLKVLEPHYPDITLSVNISSAHFAEQGFIDFLHQCLQKYPIQPSRLELEITETLLMENMSASRAVIRQIKQLGVRIAIDDFGTGYSSLSYLKKLPLDTLKIDREFIKDIPASESDMQISSVIIFLARQLGFAVVAEGVETIEQLEFLRARQCDLAQGYFFSKPIAAHKAILLLESERIGLASRDP